MPGTSPHPICFIIGSGRCGSSLIHELVARHADVGFISNIDDNLGMLNLKGRYNNPILRGPLGRFTKKGRLRFAPSEAYHLISRRVSPVYKDCYRNLRASDVSPFLRQRFEQFFSERIDAQRKTHIVHKYTGWSRAAFFKDIFPSARFVHVVRDGRAVANSFLQMRWWSGFRGPDNWSLGPLATADRQTWEDSGESLVVLAGLAWKILVESVETDIGQIGTEHVLTVRYEDFLQDPAKSLRAICDFLGLEWHTDFERQLSKSRITPERQSAYNRDLTSRQNAELQGCISAMLEAYGYI